MMIPYAKHEIAEDDIAAVERVMRSGYLTNGPVVAEFEERFKEYVKCSFSVAVSSGTAGLHLSVAALGVRPGQTVLVPSLTFAASANAVIYCGGEVEFVDIDPNTLCMDLDQVRSKIEANPSKYAGVIAVDFAGYPIDIVELSGICKKNNLWLIEDAAHALGAEFLAEDGAREMVGSGKYADATVFSFHPAKHITSGEGGMITTRDEKLATRLKLLRSHAMDKSGSESQINRWHYKIELLGYNYRISDINAALGLSQLNRIASNLESRRNIAEIYDRSLPQEMVIKFKETDKYSHSYHLYIVRLKNRNSVYEKMIDNGIYPQVHYVPLHVQPLYSKYAQDLVLPETEKYYQECLSLPMYKTLSKEEQDYVINNIKEFSKN